MTHDDRSAELRRRLWNDLSTVTKPPLGQAAAYDAVVLEQYKIYLEMADRISQRRALANTFFLTLNTGAFALIGVFWANQPSGPNSWLLIPLIALLGECFAWYSLVRTYRQLNRAKYEVIGALEERLPASPYWRAEWWALGEGKDPARYRPFSHIEQWMPILFAVTYVGAAIAAIAS